MGPAIVIVGASHAGAQLADSLRREGWEGGIVLIGEEADPPYHRPPLSKEFLSGKLDEDRLPIRDASFYAERRIDTLFGRRVAAIDRSAREVAFADGARIAYSGLALTTGARPRTLGVPGEKLTGVFVLRTVADVRAIRAHVERAERAVVVGGGFIGLECAASLRGMGKQVMVLEARERLMPRVMPPAMSSFFLRLHADHGVSILCDSVVREIAGEAGRVTAVVCGDGTAIPADLVIVGVGVAPNDELAQECGLACGNGILVDEHARTSDHSIVAAGDVALHPNRFFGGSVRLESVQNATDQARVAAATLAGRDAIYDAVPWFWSDQYEVKLQMVGTSQGHHHAVTRGDVAARRFSTFYFRDGRLTGTDSVSDPLSHMAARKLLASGAPLTPEQAADASVDLRKLGV
jgi:3-phenylpropionate/trans-cinnamate dioxygenase ferredoxin reductase subunit